VDGNPLGNSSSGRAQLQQYRKLVVIPVILVLLRLGGSAHRIYQNVHSGESLDVLAYVQAFGDPSQGWADAILFVLLNRSIRKHFADCICSPCTHDPYAIKGKAMT
jgi:hypothetical protein